MEKETRNKGVVLASLNPTASPEKTAEFIKRATVYSLEHKGDLVYLSESEGNYRVHFNSSMSDNPPLLFIVKREQKPENEEKYGKVFGDFLTVEELSEIIKSEYNARIVKKVGVSKFIIEIEQDATVKKTKVSKSEIQKLEEDLVKKHIISKEGFESRKTALKEYGIEDTSNLYKLILQKIRPQINDGEIKKPRVIYQPQNKNDELIKEMLVHICCGNNTILEGAKSTGKNVAWETVSWLLNYRLVMLQCDSSMTKSTMLGYQSTDNSSKEEITEENIENALKESKGFFSSAKKKTIALLKAILCSMSPSLKMTNGPVSEALLSAKDGNGAILILDEMNLSDPNTLAGVVNTLTDGHAETMYITGLGNVPITRDNLIIGATQNNCGGDYLGTQSQNDATMSRFVCISVKAGSSIERVLKSAVPDASNKNVSLLNSCYKQFVDLVESNSVGESCLNLRGFISALKTMELGIPYEKAVIECVVNTVSQVDDRDILEQGIEQATSEF